MSKRRAFHKGNMGDTWQRHFDAVIAAKPPQIGWRRKPNGIWVADSVNDPHMEATTEARLERERAAMEEEAREVAERFRKHRADNTPLLTAARTEI